MTLILAEYAIVGVVRTNNRTFPYMKTKYQPLLAIPCIGLLLANLTSAAQTTPDDKPAPPASAALASEPLTQDGLIGAWVGKADFPKTIGGKEKIPTTIVLAFYRDGKGCLGFLEPASDIDPKGEKGLTYDYPLTGTWKLAAGAVTLTPDPKKYPDEKPIALPLTKPEKNRLIFDLTSLGGGAGKFLGKDAKITLHPATDQELKSWFNGKCPD